MTKDDLLKEFLSLVHEMVRYWSKFDLSDIPEHKRTFHRCEGVAHSIMTILDGINGRSSTSYDLVPEGREKDWAINSGVYLNRLMRCSWVLIELQTGETGGETRGELIDMQSEESEKP